MDWVTLLIVVLWTLLGYFHGRSNGRKIADKQLQSEYWRGYYSAMQDASLVTR